MTKQAGTDRKSHEDRPHFSDLVAGLVDARVTHVSFLDTVGGSELQRFYRHLHERRRQERARARPQA